MPIGQKLKERIADHLNIRFEDGYHQSSGDHFICAALRQRAEKEDGGRGDINPLLHTCWHIRDAMPQAISIDNFIDNHRTDEPIEFCGKLAITRSILETERSSRLWVDSRDSQARLDFKALQQTWYNSFFQLLTENCGPEAIAHRLSKITFIVFNYDRCLEHYLYHALQNYYRFSSSRAAELVNAIEIYHPYGTVGPLPWKQRAGSVEFGSDPIEPKHLLEAASQIKTFTQGMDAKSSDIVNIKNKFCSANITIFLGFAFHRQNLELLRPAELSMTDKLRTKEIYGTAHGMSIADSRIVEDDLQKLTGNTTVKMHIRHDLKCHDLFQQFWRSLALSFRSE